MPKSKLTPHLARLVKSTLGIRLDTLMVCSVAGITSVATVRFELFEKLHGMTKARERYELDEFMLVLIIWCLAGIVFAGLRGAELKAEVRIREAAERQANELARFDPLTGLPNRRLFIEYVEAAGKAGRSGRALAVLLIDLDRFKPVNDHYGHDCGDMVLIEIAKRFSSLAGNLGGAMVARMGGDEFACAIECDRDADIPTKFANSAIELARMPIATTGATVTVSASIGMAIQHGQLPDSAELLRMADKAMYSAKSAGRDAVRVFDEKMDASARSANKLEGELRKAIVNQEIVPHYQPIARMADGTWSGLEVLARWRHPERGLLDAEHFIGIAESTDLIDTLAMALFERACADATAWPPHLTMSFNISPRQLRHAWLPQQLLRILTDHGIAPGRLIIELTESGLFADIDVARTMLVSLKNAGVKFALDDFGTGYSSLSHLSQLPFDIIKIDRSFIEDIDIQNQASIVTAIIRMGHSLGMRITAEGVTCERNWRTLKAFGCDLCQGFMIGRPKSAAETLRLIAAGDMHHAPEQRKAG